MARYIVKIQEVYQTHVSVEAESEQDAQSKAEELIACGCYPDGEDIPEATYDYTLDRDEWPVWEDA